MNTISQFPTGFRVGAASALALPVPAGSQVAGNALLTAPAASADTLTSGSPAPYAGGGTYSISPGDLVLIYAGRHYGRVHRVTEVIGNRVKAYQVDTHDWVCALVCDCGAAFVGGEQ